MSLLRLGVTAMVWVQPLARELPRAAGTAKKKKKKKKKPTEESAVLSYLVELF